MKIKGQKRELKNLSLDMFNCIKGSTPKQWKGESLINK